MVRRSRGQARGLQRGTTERIVIQWPGGHVTAGDVFDVLGWGSAWTVVGGMRVRLMYS